MRYADIKRLVDELLRDFLRKVDKRVSKAEKKEKKIRFGIYNGTMPSAWGPANLFDESLQIYKVNCTHSGTDFDVQIEGETTSESITQSTTFPYFLTTPVKWLKGGQLTITVNSSTDITEFEMVLTAREI